MCDRQKGILGALALEFLHTHVRHCVKHILANVKGKYPKVQVSAPFGLLFEL